MRAEILKIHPSDNVLVALRNLSAGQTVMHGAEKIEILENIPAKHKFSLGNISEGEPVIMYGVPVGKAVKPIFRASLLTTENVRHFSSEFQLNDSPEKAWNPPPLHRFEDRTFDGYYRSDGSVGTRNYWLIVPLVFCENRNIKVIREAMLEKLGYVNERSFTVDIDTLIERYKKGANESEILEYDILKGRESFSEDRLFPNVDGIKFLTHEGGCGGIRQDSETLCNLLAGYITHANVAGATVLSLGCQNAQYKILESSIKRLDPSFAKPLFVLEQQQSASEREFIAEAVKKTFAGLMQANRIERKPAGLEHLCLGLECGGSDGFSGISANPALGHASDLLVGLGGSAILSEFPELNGVEQELINRCVDRETAEKFVRLMRTYSQRAEQSGSGFDMNPSPGNIRDGLITDAMKSAGAAKKGGSSPIVDVLDYTEQARKAGLHLLCTPGNDVESTTGLAGSGANIIVFTTGLGTPTGNPVAPTLKMSSNTHLAEKMQDLIDINAGTIIDGQATIEQKGEELLDLIIETAGGRHLSSAEKLGQDDFIPWKRGVSL